MRVPFLLLVLLAVGGCGSTTAPESVPFEKAASGLNPLPAPPPPHEKKRPKPAKVPYSASGRYTVAKGQAAPRTGRGPVVRYMVEVERGLPFRPAEFAADVHRTLNDRRGWARFQRVDHGPVRLSVALSSPRLTDRQCLPLNTGGDLSCWNGHRSVINAVRWAKGVPEYRGDLDRYRKYVISHEVGHGLGHGHRYCPGRGLRAPVMVQQSKSLNGCRPNPWPHP